MTYRRLSSRSKVVTLLINQHARANRIGFAGGRLKHLTGDQSGDDLLGRVAQALQVDHDQSPISVAGAADHLIDVGRLGQRGGIEACASASTRESFIDATAALRLLRAAASA